MSSLKLSIVAALAAIAATVGGLYFIEQGRAREAARLRQENGQMRAEASQRRGAPLRSSEANALENESRPVESAASDRARLDAPPVSDYRYEGQATPVAALQTFAWACDNGDSETVERMLCFESAGRTKAEAFLAAMPAEARGQWKSLEAMAAALLTLDIMHRPFPAAPILAQAKLEEMSEGRVMLRLPGTPKDRTQYQKIGDNWHYVITEAMVDRYIAEALQRQPGGPR